jgi:hypothetical protein
MCLGVNGRAAVTVKGSVKNGTTGSPVAGSRVALLSPAGGELGRIHTDAGGRFRLTVSDEPSLVRAVHQGVDYDTPVPAAGGPVEILVYDVTGKLDGVSATLGVQRFETEGNTLWVVDQTVLRNTSNPPRTLINRRFELRLPVEAQVESGIVQSAGGQRLTRKPVVGARKGEYFFVFPLRPGETRFAVAYRLPYQGEAVIEPDILYPLKQFAVVLPKSMRFEARSPGLYRPKADETRANVYVASAVKPGQSIGFRISVAGTLARGVDKGPARPGVPARPPGSPQVAGWVFLSGTALVLGTGLAGLRAHRRKGPTCEKRPRPHSFRFEPNSRGAKR